MPRSKIHIKLKESAKIKKKADSQTKQDSVKYRKEKGRLPADAAPNFKIKIKKK